MVFQLKESDFKPHVSKIYSVGAMVVDEPFVFENEFGEGTYEAKVGDIVLCGTQGEHWIVPASKLTGPKAKYEIDGQEINLENIAHGHSLDADFTIITTKASGAITWAAQIPASLKDVEILSPEGHKLVANNSKFEHGSGDFICCADADGKPSFEWGVWPVNGKVFNATYDEPSLVDCVLEDVSTPDISDDSSGLDNDMRDEKNSDDRDEI